MSPRDEVVEHRDEFRAVASRSRIESIALVGSVPRNEDIGRSDFDFHARFADGASLFGLVGLQEDFEDLLGRDVEAISDGGLERRLRRILEEPIKP